MLNFYKSGKLLCQEIKKHVFCVFTGNWRKCGCRSCHDDPIGNTIVTNEIPTKKYSALTSVDKENKITTTLNSSSNTDIKKYEDIGANEYIGTKMVLDVVKIDGRRRSSVQVNYVPEEHIRSAEIVWEYMLMHHTLTKSDLILVLGNNDVRVAQHAAQLWLNGYSKYIMFSGYLGNLTEGVWTRPEYEVFREVAIQMGVPSDSILLETKATNTGQNVRFSYEVLNNLANADANDHVTDKRSLLPLKSIILVQTPYMERRTYATFMKQWPEDVTHMQVQVTSPKLYLRQYPNTEVGSLHDAICILLGCFQRVLQYPKKGYQIPQHIPDNVAVAYNGLADTGLYGRFLSKS